MLYHAFLVFGRPLTRLHGECCLTKRLLKEKYWVIRPDDAIALLHVASAVSLLVCALTISLFLLYGFWVTIAAILANLLLAPFLTFGITLLYCEVAVRSSNKAHLSRGEGS